MELNDILNSKIFVAEKSAINFLSPRDYINPFIDVVSSLNPTYEVAVSGVSANKNQENNEINQSFGRVKIEAKLPIEYSIEEHDSVIGIVYALDIQKPIMRIYSGRNAWACTNLAIFNAEHLHTVELLQGVGSIYQKASSFTTSITTQIEQFANKVRTMKNIELSQKQTDEVIGNLLRKAIANKTVGTTPIISAAQSLYDKNGKYSMIDGKTTEWNIYSAVTQYITDKVDIVDKAFKTVHIGSMFDGIQLNNN